MEIETVTTIIVSGLPILAAILGILKSRKRGYQTRAKEMNELLEKSMNKTEANLKESMCEMQARFEKNIGKLFDLAEYQMVSNTEVRSDIKHIKSALEMR